MNKREFQNTAQDLLNRIADCPSPFHVIARAVKDYEEAGFHRLEERHPVKLCAGEGYYLTRGDSALIAFRIPEKGKDALKGFHLAVAHCDSPTFQLKENPERKIENYVTLNVEKYGSMIDSTWLDRPLSIAGRLAVADQKSGEIRSVLVNLDQDLLVIPNLAIHMNREVNKGYVYNAQRDLQPLFSVSEKDKKGELLKILAESAGVEKESILGHDLFLYVRDRGHLLGPDKEFLLSPRLDDLQCVYVLTKSHRACVPKEYITICAILDNEEVGSSSIRGADSTFLEDVIWRIAGALELSKEQTQRLIGDGMMISADNAHAVHPCHSDKADPTNRPYLNGGVVIKYNSAQHYITNGMTAAYIKSLCMEADVPWQTFANRSDVSGGSTLGNIAVSHVSIPGADIGLPQLAMHSAMETAGVKDTLYAEKMMTVYFAK